MSDKDEPRKGWTLGSEGGAWSAEGRSDGEKWRRVNDAAREAGDKARRIFNKRGDA